MTYQDMKAQMYIAAYAAAIQQGLTDADAQLAGYLAVGHITEYFDEPTDFDDKYISPGRNR